ncbi:serine hydrolase domain-containing protein [Nocardioides sp. GXZ039]|uniref:serine hydrolase domain-containing protein n=1 Tax=Nocardioides sp. GXZ039 TaxID=3136018 RepID=UPI0030F3EE54
MSIVVAAVGIALVASSGMTVPAVADGRPPPPDSALQQRLDDVVSAGAVGALAEVRRGEDSWGMRSGSAVLGTARPVPLCGHVRIGSVTKTFVATVVLQLVEEGQLGLEDTVDGWLPGWVPDGDRITVRQLLSHTSGLYDVVPTLPFPPGRQFQANRWRTWTPVELIRRALAHPPTFTPPGSAFAYSNTNYLLLGEIIGRAAGTSYAVEIQRRIIRPLHLFDTEVPGTQVRIRGVHPHGYVPALQDDDVVRLVDWSEMNPSVFGAAGEMTSTPADLNRFFAALLGGKLISPGLLAQMKTPGVAGAAYGLGLAWRDTPCGVRVYGNDGDALAYQAWSYTTGDLRRQATVGFTPDFRADTDAVAERFIDDAVCR